MKAASAADNDRVRNVRMPVLLALIGAGLAGNYFGYDIFSGIQVVFGSIFSMLALQMFGMRWGLLAGCMIAGSTWPLWGHPYAAPVLTAEVLVVGILQKRRRNALVLNDALFWLCPGAPLAYLLYHFGLALPANAAVVELLKQAMNGITNALVARLVFMLLPSATAERSFLFREIAFNLLVVFALVPSLALLAVQSRTQLADTEHSARVALQLAGERIPRAVANRLRTHHRQIAHLASMASSQPLPVMQSAIEAYLADEPDFLRIGLLDKHAVTIAFAPRVDELGRKNLGRRFADRPFIPIMKRTLRPVLAEVVIGRVGRPRPVVSQVAPVIRQGRYAGYTIGVLRLESVHQMIALNLRDISLPGARYVLIDRNSKVIVSSRPELKTFDLFTREEGDIVRFEDGIVQWLPKNNKRSSSSDRWRTAVYYRETPIGGMAEWTLVLEQPLAPFQERLYERYARRLAWVFIIVLAALATAEWISRRAARELSDLQQVSGNLPRQLASGKEVSWPESVIAETQHLVHNFRDMAQVLAVQFHQIRKMNAELESRIAERTRELRRSEERLKKAQRIARLGNWEWDIATNGLVWSEDVFRLYGVDPHKQKPSYDIVLETLAPECRDRFRAAIEDALEQGRPFESEYRIFPLDGTVRFTYTSGEVVRDAEGRPVSMFGVVQDITERKLAEEALKKSEESYRAIVENQLEFVDRFLPDGTLTFVNSAFARHTGLKPEELIGKFFYSFIQEEDRAAIMKSIASLSREKPSEAMESRFALPDGSERWHQWMNSALFNAEGNIVEYQAVGRDITEAKRAEKALQEKTSQLEDLTRNLEQRVQAEISMRVKNEQILIQQSKMAAMGEMLGAIAHQWRQPLNALGLIVQNLKDVHAYGELDEEYLKRTVRKSMDQLQHMSKTIDDFRSFFQPDRERTEFDTMQAVGKVLTLFSAQLKANEIAFELVCHSHGKRFTNEAEIVECPEKTVRGYQNEFEHVIMNLVNNAREAILERRASGSNGQGMIAFDFFNRNGKVILSVSDNGGGVHPNVMDRIFEPYFTTKDPAKGTGLGLYMSKVIIEDHMHGRLSVQNNDRGAVFTIELPGKEDGNGAGNV